LWLLIVGHIVATPVAALTLVKGTAVTIDEADRVLRARMPSVAAPPPAASTAAGALTPNTFTSGGAKGCAAGSTQPVEIVTLAASLKCDLDLIFEYVHNNIEYEPLFGSNKGALGTLLDQRGNDIDQAQLFVALLNAAGISQTNFIYGYITLTGTKTLGCTTTPIASAPGWLGVKNDGTAITDEFVFGGIPIGPGGASIDGVDGTILCIDVAHVWVQVTIAGTNYVFDPSFKQHVVSSGLPNLGTLLGYSQSQFLTDAGGTTDSVSISNINRTKIRSDLTAYANNLVAYIKANNPAFTLNDVIGGKTIIPLTGSPIRQTSLPYLSNDQPSGFPQSWGTSVPNAYRTCFTISMPGVAPTQCGAVSSQTVQLFADQTYGQRITIFSAPDPLHSGNYIPNLLVNGVPPSDGQPFGTSLGAGATWNVSVCVWHPFVLVDYNVCNTNPVTDAKVLGIAAGGSYLVSTGWGRVGRGMVEKHRQLLAQALAVPGANPASEPILGESLAVISYNWLAENASQLLMSDAVGQTTTQYIHGIGITAQTAIQQTGSQGPYLDLPMNQIVIVPQTCWPAACSVPLNSSYTDSGTGSSFESAVLEQTQAPTPNMVAASTIKLVDQNAATGAKTFFADGTTTTGQSNYKTIIRPLLQQAGIAYSAADLSAIDMAVTGASPPPASPTPTTSQVLAPVNGAQTVGLWKGAGYTIISQTATLISITQKISGSLDGGYSGTDVPTDDQPLNTFETIETPAAAPDVPTITNPTPDANNVTINEPIDAVTGAEIYKNTDLVTGGGAFPYALPFARTYTSSSNLTDIGLGNGWTHSYSLSAAVNSDPYEGMGSSSPIRAAAAIAAIYVSQNLLSNSTQSAQFLTLAWIVNRWMTDQLTNNATLISRPGTVEEFVALPRADGQTTTLYSPPLGSSVVLTGTGTGTGNPTAFTYANKDGTKLAFTPTTGSGTSAPISSWTMPNGMLVTFSYNSSGNLTTVANNLGRNLTLSHAGSHISAVSDGSRSATFGYTGNNLTSATDPLVNRTTYAYDTSGVYDTGGHLTQVFYPNAPASPFVTNYYDGLGRVANQLNANKQSTQFYFAGSRTEIVDAVGDRHITYQTPRSKIIKDASVLSNSFGDVFNDTLQQNGIVNVASAQYDGLDRAILTVAPEGGTVGYSYSPDLENNIVAVTRTAKPGSSLAPLTTTYTYDPIYNKPTRITDPLGLVTNMGYDPATGNLLNTVADAGGAGHFNATVRFSYNNVGQALTALDPLQTLTQFSYDVFGNQVSVIRDCCGAGHLNRTTTLAYSAFGDVISSTDPNGNTTKNTYDADRRRITTTLPATSAAPGGLVTTLTYDPVGQLLQTSQSTGGTSLRQASAAYSPTGKLSKTTDANGNFALFAYDANDRLASTTDQLGRQTTYAYDTLSRQISISNLAVQSSPLLQQTYTPDGLLASLTDANSHATNFVFDGFDRLATTTYPLGSTEALTYDADSNVAMRQTRAGQTIAFAYDTLNRLTTKTPPSPAAVVSYGYDLAGHPTRLSDTSAAITAAVPPSPATSVQYATSTGYDALNRPTAVTWNPAPTAAAPTAAGVTFNHAYNKVNQRIGQIATDNSWLNYPVATPSTVSYTANALNQYTAVGAVTPSYDGNGNLTFDGTFTLGYDAENRLSSASGAGNTTSYTYDAQGRRKTKTVNGTTTVFVTDAGNREVLEYDGTSGAIQRWYAYGLSSNDLLNQNNIIAATRATLIPDIQGSIIASLDSGSGLLSKIGYLPYGKSTTAPSSFGYTGQRIDPETNGLYNFRARIYSPTLGRFLQADPIGAAGGVNLYAYVNNDPLNVTDPFGLESQYSLGTSGTLAVLFGGVGASLSVGLSVPDNPSNLGGYQLFVTLQGNAMGGVGLYGGAGLSAGISGSQGPLATGLSGTTGMYLEGDLGSGISVGASIQGNSSGGAASFTPLPNIGLGYGVWLGAGGFASGTIATPTFNQIYNGLNSICPSCSSTNTGATNPSQTTIDSAVSSTDATTPATGATANIPQIPAPSK
jgi:RHS repeat-associated protein